MGISKRDALKIAHKLEATIKSGRKHQRAEIRCDDQYVATYGISHSSHDKGHDYVPKQLHLTNRQTIDLAQCTLSKQGYFDVLRGRGLLE